MHDLVDHGEEDDDSNEFYNLDCDITDLQANLHKQHLNAQTGTIPRPKDSSFLQTGFLPKPCLSGQQWHNLDPDSRNIWDQLSDEAKFIILGLKKDLGKHSVNLHNISAYDFLQANMHSLHLERQH